MASTKSKKYSGVRFIHQKEEEIVDLTVEGSKSKKTKSKLNKSSQYVMIPAMVDLHATFGEPGNDLAESYADFSKSAHKFGFDTVCAFPNQYRPIYHKEDIQSLSRKASPQIVPIPLAVKSGNEEGQMSDLYELSKVGSRVAYMDSADDLGLIQRVQQYMNNFDGLLMIRPTLSGFRPKAQVSETPITTKLGFNGSPDLAEYIAVSDLIEIAAYNCAPLHLSGISTSQSVELIKSAKKRGIQVTCDVSIFSLCFTDEDLLAYDSNFKLKPFLRGTEHQKALLKGVKDGVIDAIASYHQACTIEQKECEFEYAEYGATSFQTFLSLGIEHVIPKIGWDNWVKATHENPLRILKISKENTKNVLIDTEGKWELNKGTRFTSAKNSPCHHKQLKGVIVELI